MFSRSLVSAARLALTPARQNTAVRLQSTATGGTGARYGPVPKALKEKMKAFQVDDGNLVHIKGGLTDKFLYFITAACCAVGLVECFHVYFRLSYPKGQIRKLILGP